MCIPNLRHTCLHSMSHLKTHCFQRVVIIITVIITLLQLIKARKKIQQKFTQYANELQKVCPIDEFNDGGVFDSHQRACNQLSAF